MFIEENHFIYSKKTGEDDDGGVGIPLSFLTTTIQNRENVCNKQSNHNGKVREKMFCAKMFQTSDNPTHTGVCSTTRGGGLYCVDNDVVTGVLSFGFSCGNSDIPSVYTQVYYIHLLSIYSNSLQPFQ